MKLEKCKCGMLSWVVDFEESGTFGCGSGAKSILICRFCQEPYPDRTEELEKEVERLKHNNKALLFSRRNCMEVVNKLEKENAELKKGIRGEIKRLKGGLSFVSRCAVLSNLEKILSGEGEG